MTYFQFFYPLTKWIKSLHKKALWHGVNPSYFHICSVFCFASKMQFGSLGLQTMLIYGFKTWHLCYYLLKPTRELHYLEEVRCCDLMQQMDDSPRHDCVICRDMVSGVDLVGQILAWWIRDIVHKLVRNIFVRMMAL